MKTRLMSAGAAAAVVALAVGALGAVVPVSAAPMTRGACTGDSQPGGGGWAWNQQHAGADNGMHRRGGTQRAARSRASTVPAPSGTLTNEQRDQLAALAEDEQLARDVYRALADKYPSLHQFERIATAEERHLSAVRTLMEHYQVADPTAGRVPGEFESTDIADLYRSLLVSATSQETALAVGVRIEQLDIADLKAALGQADAPDVKQLYERLLTGSEHHLRAFGG